MCSLYIPLLDHLLLWLKDRFGPIQQQISLAAKLVASILIVSEPLSDADQKELITAFPDMPSPLSFATEYESWVNV